jgi:hypothetical protein
MITPLVNRNHYGGLESWHPHPVSGRCVALLVCFELSLLTFRISAETLSGPAGLFSPIAANLQDFS